MRGELREPERAVDRAHVVVAAGGRARTDLGPPRVEERARHERPLVVADLDDGQPRVERRVARIARHERHGAGDERLPPRPDPSANARG